jgi:peptidoglycan hydrolase FlgJ
MPALPQIPQSNGLAFDNRSLDALRGRAATDPRGAVKEAAKQFETVFMNELMKSMRSNTLASGMFDSAGSQMSTEMLDAQFASQLSGRQGGLSEIIMKQLERQMGLTPGPIPQTGSANNTAAPLSATPRPTGIPQKGAAGFVDQHTAAARRAEAQSGIPAAFMISQAALETGWGRKEIRHSDGSTSHNLFGIKAGPNWKGPVAEIVTTEYINGRPQKVVAKFRAYGSYGESFADYARLIKNNPRYQAAFNAATGRTSAQGNGGTTEGAQAVAFAQGLQRGGYATDPAYADKLTKVINTTLRLQRSLG